jgi:cytochrome oxidase Cu insertion factor (SCO1/SenC/PrrC family)
MRKHLFGTIALAAALTAPLAAQQPTPAPARAPAPPAPPAVTPLAAGVEAPDFTLKASTKDGLSAKPVHLKDLRGQVVVLAFFYKARTKG